MEYIHISSHYCKNYIEYGLLEHHSQFFTLSSFLCSLILISFQPHCSNSLFLLWGFFYFYFLCFTPPSPVCHVQHYQILHLQSEMLEPPFPGFLQLVILVPLSVLVALNAPITKLLNNQFPIALDVCNPNKFPWIPSFATTFTIFYFLFPYTCTVQTILINGIW